MSSVHKKTARGKRTGAYYKDIFREIRKSFSRFLSIFLIVALGTGFFAGVKSTMPDMKESAADFFEENRLMDLRLVSNVGFRYSDLQAVEKLEGVLGVSAGYSCDVYYNYDGQNQVVKVMSFNTDYLDNVDSENYLNRPILIEGRLPENSGECVVENTMKTPQSYKIGEKLTFSSPSSQTDIGDIFATDTFTVVGIVASPLYIGYERDATTIGNGAVNSFVIIPEDDFTLGVYTDLYIRFEGIDRNDPFSDKYTQSIEQKKTDVIETAERSIQKRLDEQISNAQSAIDSAEKKLAEAERILSLDSVGLAEYKAELESSIRELEQLVENGAGVTYQLSLRQQQGVLQQVEALIYAEKTGNSSVVAEMRNKLSASSAELEENRQKLDAIPELKIYDYSRFSGSDYASFAGDSEKIDAISKVFPAFFVLIAALVCLTTMTRMVDEKRIEIGTYKALGYGSGKIIAKYLVYAVVPTISGTLVGTAIGFKVIPNIIYNSYKILYNIPSINTPFRTDYALGCMLVAVVCVGTVVIAACKSTLSANPSELMRPKAPPVGRRVFLERCTAIWGKLGFLTKVTFRNLMRYKKRFAMTIAGVAGCTALIMTGFGIKNSISVIVDLQFENIFLYDAAAVINSETQASESDINKLLAEYDCVEGSVCIKQIECDALNSNGEQTVNLIVPQSADCLTGYVSLTDCDSGKELELTDGKVIITEKLSQLMGVSVGDTIKINIPELAFAELEISGISENYALHYVFMSPATYKSVYGGEVQFNQALIKLSDYADRTQFSESLISSDEILGMIYLEDGAKSFLSSIESLDAIVWLLIICAAMLAFVVLYNLANININERVREIATLKVLGFYDGETSAYIYRENVLTTAIGIIIGWAAGLVLHRFVVKTSEVDVVMFSREMVWYGYVLSAVLTVVFATLVNVALHFRLKKIDMVESLKSAE